MTRRAASPATITGPRRCSPRRSTSPSTEASKKSSPSASPGGTNNGRAGINRPFSSPAFAGEGDHAKHGGGASSSRRSPSTALRAVPLPRKSGGGDRRPPFVWTPARPANGTCTCYGGFFRVRHERARAARPDKGESAMYDTTGNGDYFKAEAMEWGPRILGAIGILILAWILARAARWAIARVVDHVPALRKHYEAEPGKTLGSLIGEIAFWLILLIGIM